MKQHIFGTFFRLGDKKIFFKEKSDFELKKKCIFQKILHATYFEKNLFQKWIIYQYTLYFHKKRMKNKFEHLNQKKIFIS